MNVDKFATKSFALTLSNENLTSSDLLALYIFLLIVYRNRTKPTNTKNTIFVNEKNLRFTEKLFNNFENCEWLNNDIVEIIYVKADHKTNNDIVTASFIESLTRNYLSVEAQEHLEDTTFIMAEPFFDRADPFSDEVKSAILESANLRFDMLLVHHFTCNIPYPEGTPSPEKEETTTVVQQN